MLHRGETGRSRRRKRTKLPRTVANERGFRHDHSMFETKMQPKFATRRAFEVEGWGPGAIRRAVRRGDVIRISKGRFHPAGIEGRDLWISTLAARCHQAGSGAAASHRSAARLHGLDGDWGDPVDIMAGPNSQLRKGEGFRTRTLLPEHVTSVSGVPCTTLVRTLIDLGRLVDPSRLEMALESALRGFDPASPDDWNEGLLGALNAWPLRPRVLGHAQLRSLLALRGSVRPTGSAAETRFFQCLRRLGLEESVQRQPLVHVEDRVTGKKSSMWPDFLFPEIGFVIEVDGEIAHGKPAQRLRDDRRDNNAGAALRVVRFPASEVFRRGDALAREVALEVAARRVGGMAAGVRWIQTKPLTHRYVRDRKTPVNEQAAS